MKTLRVIAVGALVLSCAFAQSKRPEFEVVSIRPVQPNVAGGNLSVNVGMRLDGAQMTMGSMSLNDMVGMAYSVKPYQISGPDWLADRFNIQATLPTGSKPEQVNEMMQGLLADRFQLKFHRDKKDFNAYAMTAVKGNTPKPVELDPEAPENAGTFQVAGGGSAAGVNLNYGRGRTFVFADNKITVKKLDMQTIAGILERFLDRPVADLTELQGYYDVSVDMTEEDYRAMLIRSAVNAGMGASLPPQALRLLDLGSNESLFRGLEKAGIKVDARKVPLDVIVVDNLRKTPTDN